MSSATSTSAARKLECVAVVHDRDVDVDLTVGAGETVAVIGPNGAGKSTLLGVVAGLLRPDGGRVALGGRVLTEVTTGRTTWVPAHDRGIALLTQDPLLFPHLRVRDNVAFGPTSRGTPKRDARRAAEHWLATVGAEELADRRPRELSGGQAQRVAVARALAVEPQLLLLDEPTSALDVSVAASLRLTLRHLAAGVTTMVVTHDILDALLLADRVIVLEEGRVVEAGPTREVLTRPRSRFAARLAGLNMVTGRWRSGAVEGAAYRLQGRPLDPAPVEGGGAVAVFRPAAVAVFPDPPHGSPRNTFPARLTDLELRGDQVRLHAGELSADITAQSAADLDLSPGTQVYLSVKATEVSVYAT